MRRRRQKEKDSRRFFGEKRTQVSAICEAHRHHFDLGERFELKPPSAKAASPAFRAQNGKGAGRRHRDTTRSRAVARLSAKPVARSIDSGLCDSYNVSPSCDLLDHLPVSS